MYALKGEAFEPDVLVARDEHKVPGVGQRRHLTLTTCRPAGELRNAGVCTAGFLELRQRAGVLRRPQIAAN